MHARTKAVNRAAWMLYAVMLLAVPACGKQTARMRSTSMEPTIRSGQVVLVDYNAYSKAEPRRWDIVVFEPVVDDARAQWVMRVVGLPGETIMIRQDGIVVNGQLCPTPGEVPHPYGRVPSSFAETALIAYPYVVPTNAYFVLGDNVTNSYDSRFWGGVPRSKIKGKVILN